MIEIIGGLDRGSGHVSEDWVGYTVPSGCATFSGGWFSVSGNHGAGGGVCVKWDLHHRCTAFLALVDVVRQGLIASLVERVDISHGWGGNGATKSLDKSLEGGSHNYSRVYLGLLVNYVSSGQGT